MTSQEIKTVRDFNRFYTSIIGLLEQHILDSEFTLPEARVLFELFHHQPCIAADILSRIKMDKGYLSRILKAFKKRGLTEMSRSKQDGRAAQIRLSSKGKKAFKVINQTSSNQIRMLLEPLAKVERARMLGCMKEIQKLMRKTSHHYEE